MKGFIVIEGNIIATRAIVTVTQATDGVVIETDEDFLKIRPGNGDVEGLMRYVLREFNERDE